jgi:hypothetical protein
MSKVPGVSSGIGIAGSVRMSWNEFSRSTWLPK